MFKNQQITSVENIQSELSYHQHHINMIVQHSEKLSSNESKYIIRNALLYLFPRENQNIDLNCSKDELVYIASKVKALFS